MKKITFKKPTKKLIKKYKDKGYICIDMHVHSRYTDGLNRIFTILKRCKRKDIGVAIADHNEIKGSLETSKSKILVIPAIEVTVKERIDLLVYFYNFKDLKKFYNKEVKPYIDKKKIIPRLTKSIIEVLDDCSRYRCLVSLAHPFAYAYKNVNRFLKKNYNRDIIRKIHAIEVINGENTRKRNLKAVEWSKKFNKSITAGSDGHIRSEIGNVLTCCKSNNVKDFLDQIKEGKNIVIGKETRITKKLISHFSSLRKRVKYARPIILERIKDKMNGNAPTEN